MSFDLSRARGLEVGLGRIQIHITDDHPRMQLSADVPVSEDMRREMNAWMRDFFGTTNTIEDGVFLGANHGFFMNPRTYAAMRQAFRGTSDLLT